MILFNFSEAVEKNDTTNAEMEVDKSSVDPAEVNKHPKIIKGKILLFYKALLIIFQDFILQMPKQNLVNWIYWYVDSVIWCFISLSNFKNIV